jgi:hypothetical protein
MAKDLQESSDLKVYENNTGGGKTIIKPANSKTEMILVISKGVQAEV